MHCSDFHMWPSDTSLWNQRKVHVRSDTLGHFDVLRTRTRLGSRAFSAAVPLHGTVSLRTPEHWNPLTVSNVSLKPGFHYPSWRVTGFHYPSTRPVNSASGNARPSTRPVTTRAMETGQLGPSTRVVETGLKTYLFRLACSLMCCSLIVLCH